MKLRKLRQLAWDSFFLVKNESGIPPARIWLVPKRQKFCKKQLTGQVA
jgi:hypothetical protein